MEHDARWLLIAFPNIDALACGSAVSHCAAIAPVILRDWRLSEAREMVILSRIYTRTGDGGETALGDGSRRQKDDLRVSAYGCVDETNAFLGVARLDATVPLDAMLGRIQNDLFDLGADLCLPSREDEIKDGKKAPLRMSDRQVERLEEELDKLNEGLQPLRSFVLPGGIQVAAYLHVARAVARRAEREMVALARQEALGSAALRYINRLSDFLFVAARFANAGANEGDVLWRPGEHH